MAANEARRRFVTRMDVEDAARAGRSIDLRPRDLLTDEAAQTARDLDVHVSRQAASPGARSEGVDPSAGGQRQEPDLRSVVRAAVIAELGAAPPDLDAALEKVFQARNSRD